MSRRRPTQRGTTESNRPPNCSSCCFNSPPLPNCRSAAMAAPHVLVFPFPIQGHINCMLHFATALVGAGVHVTFLLTDHNLHRLGGRRGPSEPGSPRLRFLSVPDGLPDDHPRSAAYLPDLYKSLAAGTRGAFHALLERLSSLAADATGVDPTGEFPPVTCLVADGLLGWDVEIADELGVPAIVFRTASAGSLLAFLSVPKLFDLGELPFPVGGDLDEPVRGVPGMETILRRRDLPSHCRRPNATDEVNPGLHALAKLSAASSKARALVLNTTASLERIALEHIAPRVRDLFAIGPLHAMSPAAASCSLLREDGGCVAWLDGQPDRSVVYASLGSLATISREQFTELFSGLVATGYPFLWVLRPDMVADAAALQEEAVRAAGGGGSSKARVVPWAPQREVLRHRAVGCFLTHAGWNSTLEAVVEGVPTVCWPSSADQQMNSRFVGAVWRTGLDMKDVCDRAVVERTVREAMESAEIRRSAQSMAQQVKLDIAAGGSSATEFQRLVGLIRELSKSYATRALGQ